MQKVSFNLAARHELSISRFAVFSSLRHDRRPYLCLFISIWQITNEDDSRYSRRSACNKHPTHMHYHRLLQNINVVRLAASVEPVVGRDGMGWEAFQFDDFSGQLHGGALVVVGLVIVMGMRKCGAVSILAHIVCVVVWIRTSF
jgi:hypothetical protein